MFYSRHFHSEPVMTISADRGCRLGAPDSFTRKARCLCTCIVPRGYPGPRDGNELTGRERGRKRGRIGVGVGVGVEKGAGKGTGTVMGTGTRTEPMRRDGEPARYGCVCR